MLLTAFGKRLHSRDEGFTLIELLVVVIIIGILAAVAIPVFLNQRVRGWEAAAQSDLRNAAVAQESYFTAESTYANQAAVDAGALVDEGFSGSADVNFRVVGANATSYCMAAQHDSGGSVFVLDSAVGAPAAVAGNLASASC